MTDPGLTGYDLYRSESVSGPFELIGEGVQGGFWDDEGLPESSSYFYQVVARNEYGNASSPSETVSGTTFHPLATYSSWARMALAGLTGASANPEGDPDGDGLVNLLEYTFLTDPTERDAMPLAISLLPGGEPALHFPWNWRATDYTWRLRHGADLGVAASWPVAAPGAVTTLRAGDIDEVTSSPLESLTGRGFYQLEVVPVD